MSSWEVEGVRTGESSICGGRRMSSCEGLRSGKSGTMVAPKVGAWGLFAMVGGSSRVIGGWCDVEVRVDQWLESGSPEDCRQRDGRGVESVSLW